LHFGPTKLQSKFAEIKKISTAFKTLTKKNGFSGFGQDSNGAWTCSHDMWDSFVESHPEVAAFKGEPLHPGGDVRLIPPPFYEALMPLLGDSLACGQYARLPPRPSSLCNASFSNDQLQCEERKEDFLDSSGELSDLETRASEAPRNQ